MGTLRAVFLGACLSYAAPATAQDLLAPVAAAELRQICQADSTQLWGVDLCGPLLVVDPTTRMAWASERDSTGALRRSGDGFIGRLPANVTVANTAIDWAGARWIMVLAPLPEDSTQRRVLIAHEAWHRVQARLNLPAAASDCTHLESERGRYLLRLELRALATAMRSRGSGRRAAVRDALLFRNVRLSEFPNAAAQEAALDRNEGLAAYTGARLGVATGADMFAARTLDQYDRHDAYARSYAYATGPAYGLLLDETAPAWRVSLGGDAPANALQRALRIDRFDAARFPVAAARYNGATLLAEERTRASERVVRIADLRRRFASGPRLVLPVSAMQMEFDPNRVTPVDGLGSVYAALNVLDVWGELRANEGALISSDFTRIVLPAPNPDGLSGPGWSISLAAGAQIVEPDADGVRTVTAPAAGGIRAP